MNKNYLKNNNISKITKTKEKNPFLMWEMFGDCNFNCKECFQNFYRANAICSVNDFKKIKQNSKKVFLFCKKNNFRTLKIYGGEPTLLENKKMVSVLKKFKKIKNLNFEFFSNFSCDWSYFIPIIKCFKERIYLIFSFHKNGISLNNYYKKIILLLDELRKKKLKTNIILEFTATEKNIYDLKNFLYVFETIKKNYKDFFIDVSIHEEIKLNKKHKMIYTFDVRSSKYLEKKYFNKVAKNKYNIIYNNKTENNNINPIYNVSFKNSKCKTDGYIINLLGELTNFCGTKIIIKNFFNSNVKKIILEDYMICESSCCWWWFSEVK
jgi:organic radical activating enzyme